MRNTTRMRRTEAVTQKEQVKPKLDRPVKRKPRRLTNAFHSVCNHCCEIVYL